MKRNTRSLALLSSALLLFVSGQCARAATLVEVVNVNCGHKRENLANGDGAMNGRANAADRGVAPVAYPGSTWNDGLGGAGARLRNSVNNATAVSFRISDGTYSADDWVANNEPMLKGGWTRPDKILLEINGLDHINRYHLYLASQDSFGRNCGGSFTTSNTSDAGDNILVSTGKNPNGATWVEGEDYVAIKNITPAAGGTIRITVTPGPGGGSATLNGFQLVRIEPRSPTTTTLARATGTDPSKFGEALTFTATVAGDRPAGKVAFFDGDVPLGIREVNQECKACLTTESLAGGTHNLTAKYQGDATNAPCLSASLTQSVTDQRTATVTTLAKPVGGTNGYPYGEPVTFIAKVTGVKPTGKVIFYDFDGRMVTPIGNYDPRYGKVAVGSNPLPPLGEGILNESCMAKVTINNLACGSHSITARYEGDLNNSPATPTAPLDVSVRPRAGNGKLKVFILSGQSNMEGAGKVDLGGNPDTESKDPNIIGGLGSLRAMVVNNPARYGWLVDPAHPVSYAGFKGGENLPGWVASDHVWISYWGGEGGNPDPKAPTVERKNGPLTVGFGGQCGMPEGYIGPEFGFGKSLGNAIADPVLLIKVSWGGRSLAGDFRPPSSGGTLGFSYKLLVEKVHEVLNNLQKYAPNYQGNGYEITGFGWHQGWNDRINADYTAQYETNLTNLIKDLRAEFGAPKMRFVIGATGMGDANLDPTAVALIAAQTAVSDPAKHPEFAGTVATVDTRAFDYGVNSPSPPNGYHWNFNGESYFHIGEAMGMAMMELLANK
ncbi:MAG: Ig-like domain repeat protein [Akkermansiaceae bacterium]|nr:Ig-like domain repeat protein [Akkermansiaceae bacterium]